jgi:PAS domain S-box-containing protein
MTGLPAVLLAVALIQAGVILALLAMRTRSARAGCGQRESEKRFRLMVDRAPGMFWTARPDTTLDYVNRYCAEFTGLPIEKLLDEGWLSALHPEDRELAASIYVPAIKAHRPFLVEYRMLHADGSYRWVLATGIPTYGTDGAFSGYVGIDIDITERKNAEDRIRESAAALEASHRQIQRLAGRLIEAQDAERARIARDLHDDVSQQVAGLAIALSRLKHRVDASHAGEDIQADLQSLNQRAINLAQNVRNLSHDLHPTVLRHAGLVAALTSYCAEIARLHGTDVKCSAEGNFTSMAPEAALCLYRIAQEALRNVVAHAKASSAEVRLRRASDYAEITIADDGKGFDLEHSLERCKGLGLVSITERVRLAGGTLSVRAELTKGTSVHAQIPAPVLLSPA